MWLCHREVIWASSVPCEWETGRGARRDLSASDPALTKLVSPRLCRGSVSVVA